MIDVMVREIDDVRFAVQKNKLPGKNTGVDFCD